jgi:hypothetical protein
VALFVVWEAVFAIDYFLGRGMANSHLFLFGFTILFFTATCIATIYCTRSLTLFYPQLPTFVDEPGDTLRKWYQSKLRSAYEGILPLISGMVFAGFTLASIRDFIEELSQGNDALLYFRYGYCFAGFALTGISLWALVRVMTIPIGLARFKIKVSMYQFAGNGLQALGATYFRMSLSIIMSFVLILGIGYFSPFRTNPVIVGWMVFGTLLILGFFIIPQINIHKIMVREKSMRLASFSRHFEAAMETALHDPSSENMNRLKELFELHQYLGNMHEWPFDTQTLWQLLTALLIPVVLALLEIFF